MINYQLTIWILNNHLNNVLKWLWLLQPDHFLMFLFPWVIISTYKTFEDVTSGIWEFVISILYYLSNVLQSGW